MIVAAQVFDVYVGTGVPDGKKSVALSITISTIDRTLTTAGDRGDRPESRRPGRKRPAARVRGLIPFSREGGRRCPKGGMRAFACPNKPRRMRG